jgi:hypothetical protein
MEENDVKIYEVVMSDVAHNEVNRLVRKKRYVSLPRQIISLIDDIENGILNGDVVLSYSNPTRIDVYKVRLPNPDANAGKSTGIGCCMHWFLNVNLLLYYQYITKKK